jgi:uncharacterized membrane protein
MTERNFDKLLQVALFFVAYWFFGNLYEEIVLIPNQLVNSLDALNCWQSYFSVTDQLYYFVPCLLASVILTSILFFKCKERVQRKLLKKATIFAMLAAGLSVIIINEVNEKLFYGNLEEYKEQLQFFAALWLLGNTIRLCMVAVAMHSLFKIIVHRKSRRYEI